MHKNLPAFAKRFLIIYRKAKPDLFNKYLFNKVGTCGLDLHNINTRYIEIIPADSLYGRC